MSHIAVVYHSGFGHTEVLANHVAKGADSVPGTHVKLVNAVDLATPDAGPWKELEKADAIIFGSPTYMGSASAPFKQFMDASSKVWAAQGWKNKIAAGFTVSASQSGDKLATLQQLAVFAAQHGMIWVGTGLMPGNNSSKASVDDVNRLGSFLGMMAQANADQGPDVAPPHADRKTAELFGMRAAELTSQFVRGKQLVAA